MATELQRTIKIAKDLSLDGTAATQKFGVLGRSEAGKTYLAGRLVEELHRVGCQVIILDPVGVWWGLTLAANGKDAGLPFVVFGGKRGQLPLSADNGRRIARLVVERGLSVVLDLTGLRKRRRPGRAEGPESDLQRFVADFQEEALEASQRDPKPRMAVYDEAQMILPQVVSAGGERMLGTGEDLVRTGRNSGWGFVLMSQRPQSIHKEVLSQVECFFVGQLTEPHARNRLKEWIVEKKADVSTELDDLVKLERGEFYCWSPQWLRVFKRIRVLPKWTFDASRTPELGDMLLPGAPRKSSISGNELESLRRALEQGDGVASPAKSGEEGERLRRERALRLAAESRAERAERSARSLEAGLTELQRRVGELLAGAGALEAPNAPTATGASVKTDEPEPMSGAGRQKRRTPPEKAAVARAARPSSTATAPVPKKKAGSPAMALDKCQRAILTVLMQEGKPVPHARLARLAGYPARTSSVKNALSKLRTAGRVQGGGRDAISITNSGRETMGSVPALPRGRALFEHWLQDRRTDKCSRAILVALRNIGGAAGKEELASVTGYPADTSSLKNGLSKLRTLGLIQGRGAVESRPRVALKAKEETMGWFND